MGYAPSTMSLITREDMMGLRFEATIPNLEGCPRIWTVLVLLKHLVARVGIHSHNDVTSRACIVISNHSEIYQERLIGISPSRYARRRL